MSISIYLAGAISPYLNSRDSGKATEWRGFAKELLEDCGIKVFDPTELLDEHLKFPNEYNNGIIFQNYAYLNKCDIMLLNLDKFEDSVGSIFEVSIMWQQHKPVIAFGECPVWSDRPHFRSIISIKLNNVQDACDYIASMYNQKL